MIRNVAAAPAAAAAQSGPDRVLVRRILEMGFDLEIIRGSL